MDVQGPSTEFQIPVYRYCRAPTSTWPWKSSSLTLSSLVVCRTVSTTIQMVQFRKPIFMIDWVWTSDLLCCRYHQRPLKEAECRFWPEEIGHLNSTHLLLHPGLQLPNRPGRLPYIRFLASTPALPPTQPLAPCPLLSGLNGGKPSRRTKGPDVPPLSRDGNQYRERTSSPLHQQHSSDLPDLVQ